MVASQISLIGYLSYLMAVEPVFLVTQNNLNIYNIRTLTSTDTHIKILTL